MKINENYMKALEEHVVAIPEGFNTLKQLYQKGYTIYIATNGPKKAAISKIKKLKIDSFLKDIIFAEDVGYMKPRKEFFEDMFSKFQIQDKSKGLMIGDENAKDICRS